MEDNNVEIYEAEPIEEIEEGGLSKGLIVAGAAAIAGIGVGIVAAVKHFFGKKEPIEIVEGEEEVVTIEEDTIKVQVEE